ncbi:MAG: alpha/beta hydrolase [Gammaproteobacteria bacterium]|nr:alpha/beta hydrolase [Gammaproteobacteria bacterium]
MESQKVLIGTGNAPLVYRRWQTATQRPLPPLVLIHGAASNLTRWSEFIETTRLKETRDILRLDLRGHGQSLYRGKLSLEIWADDVATILRHEKIARAVVGGHCLGANIAAMFAARHPDMTAGLALVEPMLRPALTGALRRLIPFTALLGFFAALIRLANRIGIHRRNLEILDLHELDREFRARLNTPGGGEALVKRYASPLHDLKIMPTANFLQDLIEVMRSLPLDNLRAPFLALLSTGRTFADPVITQEVLSPLAQGQIFRLDAKHWIPTEQPEAMRSAIEEWCDRIR